MPARYGQLIIGPPGSGKSTYCNGMHQFLSAVGRPCSIVNLDPANDDTSYTAALDVRGLVNLEDIMREEELGPNGGVLHALEALEQDFDWLKDGLEQLGEDYILFDCPGQVELFTHHNSLRNVFYKLQKLGYRLVVMHMVDSFVLSRPSLYMSALLLSLRSMLQLDLPTLNVLTKIDNLSHYPSLPFNLDFYTEVHDLEYLLPYLNAELDGKDVSVDHPDEVAPEELQDQPEGKFTALNRAITSLVADFALVAFEPLCVEDKATMAALLASADKATGHVFADTDADTVWKIAVDSGATSLDIRDVQERWIDRKVEMDEMEREAWKKEGEEWRGNGEEAADEVHHAGGEDLDDEVEAWKGMMGREVPGSGIRVVRTGQNALQTTNR
jgi:GPN-loop GTPase